MCALLTYTNSISILCVSQEGDVVLLKDKQDVVLLSLISKVRLQQVSKD